MRHNSNHKAVIKAFLQFSVLNLAIFAGLMLAARLAH